MGAAIAGLVMIGGILVVIVSLIQAATGKVKILPCRACKGPVSSHAGRCPHCGHPVKK